MNERIRELAFEAANGMLSYDGEGEWRLSQKEAERFAELIVRECAAYAFSDDQDHKAMLKHFGVEE